MEPTASYEESEALDLRYYANLAMRNLAILIAVPLVFGGLAFLNSNRATRMYAATSLVLLRPNDPNERLGSSNASQTNTNVGEQYARSQANLARGPEVRSAAADATDHEVLEIEDAVGVTALVDSNTLEITVTTDEALKSKQIADALPEKLKKHAHGRPPDSTQPSRMVPSSRVTTRASAMRSMISRLWVAIMIDVPNLWNC